MNQLNVWDLGECGSCPAARRWVLVLVHKSLKTTWRGGMRESTKSKAIANRLDTLFKDLRFSRKNVQESTNQKNKGLNSLSGQICNMHLSDTSFLKPIIIIYHSIFSY